MSDLTFSTASAHGIHFARCDYCMYGQCPGGDHRWANDDDIAHAASIGRPETAEGRCGCPCAEGPVLETEPDGPDLDEPVPLDARPCSICGETGPCGYDPEGRPLIHANGWDEDDE